MKAFSLIWKKMKAITKIQWAIFIVIVCIAGYIVFRQVVAPKKAEPKQYSVIRGPLQDILALSGLIDAHEKVSLHFQTGGRLTWVGVKEGDVIQKYAGIASLDQRQLQKNLEKNLNTFSKERREFDQNYEDNDNLAIDLQRLVRERAQRTLENAQFDLNNTILDVELQTIAKEYAYLYSPIAGVVTRVDAADPGMNISVTDMYEVINPESVYFSLTADQTEVVKLHEGQKGTVVFDAFPEEKAEGAISKISFTPKTNETGTVYEVSMSLPSVDFNKYRLGMTGDVEFIMDEIKNTISIPIEYIMEENDTKFVYKKVSGKKEKVEVSVGKEYGGSVQILNGLVEGDIIYEVFP